MAQYPQADPCLHPIPMTAEQRVTYEAICQQGLPDELIRFLNKKSYDDMDHLLRTIACWVTTIYHPTKA